MKIAIVKKTTVSKICAVCLAFLFVCAMLFSANQTAVTSATNRKVPVYKVDTQNKVVSLTFDAAWGAENFYQIIEILDKHNVKTSFFMTGEWVSKYPEC